LQQIQFALPAKTLAGMYSFVVGGCFAIVWFMIKEQLSFPAVLIHGFCNHYTSK